MAGYRYGGSSGGSGVDSVARNDATQARTKADNALAQIASMPTAAEVATLQSTQTIQDTQIALKADAVLNATDAEVAAIQLALQTQLDTKPDLAVKSAVRQGDQSILVTYTDNTTVSIPGSPVTDISGKADLTVVQAQDARVTTLEGQTHDGSAQDTALANHVADAGAHAGTFDDTALLAADVANAAAIATHIGDAGAHSDTVYDDTALAARATALETAQTAQDSVISDKAEQLDLDATNTNLATEITDRTNADLLDEKLANKVTTVATPGDDTNYPTEKAVRDAIDAINFAGDYQGSATTLAALPNPTSANGNWAILSQDDGANVSGIYVTDGTSYSLAKAIPTIGVLTDAQIQDITDTTAGSVAGGKQLYDREQALKGVSTDFNAADPDHEVAKVWDAKTIKEATQTQEWQYSTDGMNAVNGDKIIVQPNHTINFPSVADLESVMLAPSTGDWKDIAQGSGTFNPDAAWTFGNNQNLFFGSDVITAISNLGSTNWLLLSGGEDAPSQDTRYATVLDLPAPATVNPGAVGVVYNDAIPANNKAYVARTDGVTATVAVAWA